MTQASQAYRRLARCTTHELERLLLAGETPSIAGIVGFRYRGYNHPRVAALLGIQKFIKSFFVSTASEAFGCNTPVVQNGLDGEWRALPNDDHPKRFGYFRVASVEPESRDNAYLHAILFDYGRGGNRGYGLTARLRDYVVRVEAGSDDLLLGKAYLALGPARLALSFFLLECDRPLRDDEKLLK